MTKKIASIAVAASMMLMVAGPAMGQTIQDLLNQIAALQAQLLALQGGAQAYAFTRSLYQGLSGADVTALQNYLKGAGYFSATATGFFGPITKAAVAAWQAANGVSPAAGYFGSLSIAKYNALVKAPAASPTPSASVSPTPAAVGEGSLEVKAYPDPADNTAVKLGQSAVKVYTVSVKAKDADEVIKRFDVIFDLRPWLYFSNVALYDGDNAIVGVVPSSSNTSELAAGDPDGAIGNGTDYRLRFDGLNIPVAKNQTKYLGIRVSVPSALAQAVVDQEFVVPTTGIRAVDAAGISEQFGMGVLRTIDLQGLTDGQIQVSANTSSPAERVVSVSTTDTTDNVEALRVDFKAKDNAVTIKELKFLVKDDNSTNPSLTATGIKLYDGDTVIASESTAADSDTAGITFTDLTVGPIAKDSTKTLVVKLILNKIDAGAATSGEAVYVDFDDIVDAEDANFTDISATETGSADGKKIYLYEVAPQIALVSGSISGTTTGQSTSTLIADGKITVNVTAVGGDIFASSTAGVNFVASSSAEVLTYDVSPVSGVTEQPNGNWKIASGQTGKFDVTVHLDNSGGAAGFKKAWLSEFTWSDTDSLDPADFVTWIDQLGLFQADVITNVYKTNSLNLAD